MPWHATEDLMAALALPRVPRRVYTQFCRKAWGGRFRTIATAEGVAVVGPHHVAQGLIGAIVEQGVAPASVEDECARAGAEALQILVRGVGSIEEREIGLGRCRLSSLG